ncbi:MAG: hypothetical protein V3R95_04975 [Dehalococcoidia bacterium]
MAFFFFAVLLLDFALDVPEAPFDELSLEELLLEELESEEPEDADDFSEPDFALLSEPDFAPRGSSPRESVLYQPEPLKAIAGAVSTRVACLPHFSQRWVVEEPKGSRRS